jgi:uncharacterized protein (TIGR03086 family)
MDIDLISLFDQASAWTGGKIAGAAGRRTAATPCDEWDSGRLLDHLLDGQRIFVAGAEGKVVGPPQGNPPVLAGEDPVTEYEAARRATIAAYSRPGVLAGAVNTPYGPMPVAQFLGIAVCDQLIHGWDLAHATGQDETMPEHLAAAAWQLLGGRISDGTRGPGKSFKAEVPVPGSASAQARLLGYSGRQP